MSKCFEAVKDVVEEANKQFAPMWKANEENLDCLREYCEAFDDLAKEFDGVSFEINIAEIDMTIEISFECPELTIHSKQNNLYELMERSIRFRVHQSKDGNVVMSFVFPSIWEKA